MLSNRADLVNDGDALVEVVLPPGTAPGAVHVDVGGRDVTGAFGLRGDGRFFGLVTGLALGNNIVTAHLPSSSDSDSDSDTTVVGPATG